MPLGLGYRFALSKVWRMGFEFTYTKTFSDYIDDVSNVYYDQASLGAQLGPQAAYFSNPAYENVEWFGTGNQRGDDGEFDAYLYFNVVFYKRLNGTGILKVGKGRTYKGKRKYKF